MIARSRPAPTIDEGCHCQDKPACPLPGRCHTPGVVYKATVTITDPGNNNAEETYTGLTGGPFRKRHYGHVDDMKEENKNKPGTTLSRHIHKLTITYMQKAGDTGDISPPIFWIFRQILG